MKKKRATQWSPERRARFEARKRKLNPIKVEQQKVEQQIEEPSYVEAYCNRPMTLEELVDKRRNLQREVREYDSLINEKLIQLNLK